MNKKKQKKKDLQRLSRSDTHPINRPSFVAADTNLYKAAYNCLLEKWHRAPSFQLMTRQTYPCQFLFGWDRLRLSPRSPFPRLFVFLRVWTSWRHRWWWWRTATFIVSSSSSSSLYMVVMLTLIVSAVVISLIIVVFIIIRVYILSFEPFLLELFFLFLRLLLLQLLRWKSELSSKIWK